MDAQRYLLDSDRHRRRRNRWFTSAGSIVFHSLLVLVFVFASAHSSKHSKAADKSITAFVAQGAAPPPPPPPPPPKGSAAPKSTPKVQPKPVQIPRTTFVAPTEIKELPKLEPLPTSIDIASLPNMTSSVEEPAGVEGGVAGGVEGGETGGVIGGVVGGVQGGEIGGVVGGQVGGTGTGTEGTGTGGVEAPVVPEPPPPPPPPPPTPTAPLRVGGDVKAPVAINRAEPNYTDTARKSRIEGVVVVEAIISRNGTVEDVRVIKGLPMGLSEEAKEAVKKWRFKPGSLNGVPVATIFNLTVTFKLN